MLSAVQKTQKRCPPLNKEPKKMTMKQLQKVHERYNDYLNAMLNEDGWVGIYERTIQTVGPYFEEYEQRAKTSILARIQEDFKLTHLSNESIKVLKSCVGKDVKITIEVLKW